MNMDPQKYFTIIEKLVAKEWENKTDENFGKPTIIISKEHDVKLIMYDVGENGYSVASMYGCKLIENVIGIFDRTLRGGNRTLIRTPGTLNILQF